MKVKPLHAIRFLRNERLLPAFFGGETFKIPADNHHIVLNRIRRASSRPYLHRIEAVQVGLQPLDNSLESLVDRPHAIAETDDRGQLLERVYGLKEPWRLVILDRRDNEVVRPRLLVPAFILEFFNNTVRV